MGAPLFQKFDGLRIPVPDLDAGLAFYRDRLGHPVIWRTSDSAGLRLPGTDAELVIHTERKAVETDLLVDSADEAATRIAQAGGKVIVDPFDIPVGRCGVVEDPWGNRLVLVDLNKGLLVTDADGDVQTDAEGAPIVRPPVPPRSRSPRAPLISRQQVMDVILKVHSAESCCTNEDLLASRVTICERLPERLSDPNHRRFPRWEPDFGIVSLGQGAVVSASATLLDLVHRVFAGADRDSAFRADRLGRIADAVASSGQRLFGPIHLFSTSSEDLRTVPHPPQVRITVEDSRVLSSLRAEEWPHSLPERPGRPMRVVAVARSAHGVIGIATAAEDAPGLWQIGIDVVPDGRGNGVGRSLTSALAGAVLDAGAVPYYGTTVANIPSIRTALSAGFWPAWTEVWVKGVAPVDATD